MALIWQSLLAWWQSFRDWRGRRADQPEEPVLAAIAKLRVRPATADDSDLVAGYVDEETDLNVVD